MDINNNNNTITWKTFLQPAMQQFNINNYTLEDGDITIDGTEWKMSDKETLNQYFTINEDGNLELLNSSKNFVIEPSEQVTYKTLLQLIFHKLNIASTFDKDKKMISRKQYYVFTMNNDTKLKLDPYFTTEHQNKILPVIKDDTTIYLDASDYKDCTNLANALSYEAAKIGITDTSIFSNIKVTTSKNITTCNWYFDDMNCTNVNSLRKYCIQNIPTGATLKCFSLRNPYRFNIPANTQPTFLDLVNICCLLNGESTMQDNFSAGESKSGAKYYSMISYDDQNTEYKIYFNRFQTVFPTIITNSDSTSTTFKLYKCNEVNSKKMYYIEFVFHMNNYCRSIGYGGSNDFIHNKKNNK